MTFGRAGTSTIDGRAASQESELSTKKAAPWSGAGSCQLVGAKTEPVPTTTSRGPCAVEGDSFARSAAMATTCAPWSTPSSGGAPVQSAAPAIDDTAYD